MRPWSGLGLCLVMSAPTRAGNPAPPTSRSRSPSSPRSSLATPSFSCDGKPGLLQRVGERVVADVVQQRREPHGQPVLLGDARPARRAPPATRAPSGSGGTRRARARSGCGWRRDRRGRRGRAGGRSGAAGRSAVSSAATAKRSSRMLSQSGSRMTSKSGAWAMGSAARERSPRARGTRVRREALSGAAVAQALVSQRLPLTDAPAGLPRPLAPAEPVEPRFAQARTGSASGRVRRRRRAAISAIEATCSAGGALTRSRAPYCRRTLRPSRP